MADNNPPSANPSLGYPVRDSLLVGALVIVLFLVGGVLLLAVRPGSDAAAANVEIQFFAVFTGISVFFLTSAKYVVSRERFYLPLAMGLLAASLLDLADPIVRTLGAWGSLTVAATTPDYLASLAGLAFAGGMFAAAFRFHRGRLDDRAGRVLVLTSAAVLATVLAAFLLVLRVPFPDYYAVRVAGVLGAPLVPSLVLAGAAAVLLGPTRAGTRGLRTVGLVSVSVAFTADVFSAFARAPFDVPFFVGRVLKVASYVVILFGLYVEHVRLYSLERSLRESIETANVELKLAKVELDAIIEDLTDGVMVMDETGKIIRFNRAARELMGDEGMGQRPEAEPRRRVFDLQGRPVPSDRYAIVRALRTGEVVRDEALIVERANGERRYIVAGAAPLRDARGRIRGAVAAFNDVSEIRTAEQRFRDLTESAPDAILVADQRWRIVLFNRAAEALFGTPREEVYGQDVSILIPPRLQAGHLAARDEYRRTGVPPVLKEPLNVRGLRKDGAEVPVQVSVSSSGEGPGRFFIAQIRDMTALERVRREREGLLSVAVASSGTVTVEDFLARAASAIVGSTDFEACTVYLHDPARNALHLAGHAGLEEDIRSKIAHYPLDPKFPAIAVRTWFQKKVLTESHLEDRTDYHVQPGLLAKYGFGSVVSAPLGNGGDPQGVLQVVTTPGRHARGEDIQLIELLAHELSVGLRQKRLIAQLEESTLELRQANEELDSFIYTASHDLAEPLRSISNFSHFLIEDYADRLDEEGRDYLQRVHAGGLRMKRLLDDLLRLSRHGRSRTPKVRVRVDEVLTEVRESIDASLRERKARLVVQPDIPDVVADRTSLLEVFTNLIGNGLKFNHAPEPLVEVTGARRDGMVELRVKDNGIGIPAEQHARIFGLFTRLHTRNEYPGTGAGLAIVKKIVENHGGRIWVESTVGRGSTFIFTIPAAPVASPRLEVAQARPAAP